MPKDKMKNVMVLVKPVVYDKIKMLSERTGNSFASIVRTAVDEYIQRNTPTILVPDEK